jgi:integrase
MIPTNPLSLLERSERPRQGRTRLRVLSTDEIERLLAAADPTWRVLLEVALFAGLRSGELGALRWMDVDLDALVIRVRCQLGRDGQRVALKSDAANRDVHLAPSLARSLAAHRLQSRYSANYDAVFADPSGDAIGYHAMIRRSVVPAAERAGLPGVTMHTLRHTYASVLIATGANVKWVQGQLGHTKASMTLDTYAALWEQAGQAERVTGLIEQRFGQSIGTAGAG